MTGGPSRNGRERAAVRPKRQSLRDAQREFTRRLLIDASVTVFVREGYAHTTIDQIVDEASATRATFYQHFRSKLDVARAVQAEVAAVGEATMNEAYGTWQRGATEADVRAWMEKSIAYFERHRVQLRVIEDAASEDVELRRWRREELERTVSVLEQHLSTLDCEHPADLYAMALIAQLSEFLRQWMLYDWPADRDEVIDMFTTLWCDALQVPR